MSAPGCDRAGARTSHPFTPVLGLLSQFCCRAGAHHVVLLVWAHMGHIPSKGEVMQVLTSYVDQLPSTMADMSMLVTHKARCTGSGRNTLPIHAGPRALHIAASTVVVVRQHVGLGVGKKGGKGGGGWTSWVVAGMLASGG